MFRAFVFFVVAAAAAGQTAPSISDTTPTFDRLWDLTNLYEDGDNPVLQYLHVTGRAHGQYHWSDCANDDEGWEFRRLRLGLEAKMFGEFIFKIETNSGFNANPIYDGLSNLSVQC